MDKNIAIKNVGNTCCNCLKETKVHNIHIGAMGYGSGFDNFSTQVDLCDECLLLTDPEWWKLKRKIAFSDGDYNFHCYEFEDDIFKFIKQMPLAGQELFWNTYGYEACADITMNQQDWIDYELGILSHDKCKEYGCYSPQEINAYHERFPKCQHPVNKIYNDNSKGCWCPFGASGKYNQEYDINISNECYKCKHFIERTTPIRDILDKDYYDYKIYYVAKINEQKYRSKFE